MKRKSQGDLPKYLQSLDFSNVNSFTNFVSNEKCSSTIKLMKRGTETDSWSPGAGVAYDSEEVAPGSSFLVVVMQNYTGDKTESNYTQKHAHTNECIETLLKSE